MARGEYTNPVLVRNLCVACANYLQKTYPSYAWGVKPSVDLSMIEIVAFAPDISQQHGFMYKTQSLQNYTDRNRLLSKAGGEILERYHLARHRRTDTSEVALARNTRGTILPET